MSRFNLIDDPWIPVRDLNGNRKELRIRDVLLNAQNLAAIEDPSPLIVAALHRFLLAVLYRALMEPTDIDQAKVLFRNGIPADKIEEYLKTWRERFWLFDEKYPFGQIPSFNPKEWRSWTALATEHNADNAKVLFDHVDVQNSGSISEATAIRWILATQTFSVSSGKSELAHTGTAPSASSAMVIPLGSNLQDTLLFLLVPQNREILKEDLPLWERKIETADDLKMNPGRPATGLSDRYTWRSRTVRLESGSEVGIRRVAFASGLECTSRDQRDPMAGYRISEKWGKLPVRFGERGLWREFDSLLPDNDDLAPQVIENAIALARTERSRLPHSVMVLGQSNDNAKIEFWRMERFVLPTALAGDRFIRSEIRRLLDLVENYGDLLKKACEGYAKSILSREEEKKGRRIPKTDIDEFVSQMPSIPWYWSSLESTFHDVLQNYSLSKSREEIEVEWLRSLRGALKEAWHMHSRSVSMGDAWAIRALVKAEVPIRKALAELNNTIAEFQKDLVKEAV